MTDDDVVARIAEYARRYLNVKSLLLCEAPAHWADLEGLEDKVVALPNIGSADVEAILEDVEANGVIYLVYRTSEHNPEAVLLPYKRYGELLAAEIEYDRQQGKTDEGRGK